MIDPSTSYLDLIEYRRKLDAFSDTELGKLFVRFENAHASAWVVDSTSDSTRRMKEAWAKSDEARNAFVTKLAELLGIEAPIYKLRSQIEEEPSGDDTDGAEQRQEP